MPDLAQQSLELGGSFFGAAFYEASRHFPPALRHLFCEGIELLVNFLGCREGINGIALVAGKDEAGYAAEVFIVELFG